jgi:5-methylcytosine-specific restriction endonuclease McrA
MRFEIVITIIALLVMANIYTDGKYIKVLLSWKKYYQILGVAFVAYMLCWLLRKNPQRARDIITSSNEYLKYLPVDSKTTSFIAPILDFTSKHQSFGGGIPDVEPQYRERLLRSGGSKATKRSVSETKKKFVAAKQNWRCGDCQKQLPAWFEVDHTVRLEHGGTNHVDNLVALCRDCHGKKTSIENL